MTLFLALFLKILPLYFMVLLGYIGGQVLKIDSKNISVLLIYTIVPVTFFGVLATAEIKLSYLPIVLISFTLCSFVGLLSYRVFKRFWSDGTENLLAVAGGSGNAGFFGLPIAFALFSDDMIGAYMLFLIGMGIFQSTVGYYFVAKANFHMKDALYKTLRLPFLSASLLAVLTQWAGVEFGEIPRALFTDFKSAYSILGMMLIGMAMAHVNIRKTDWRFVLSTLGVKFIFWPMLMLFVIFIDRNFLELYTANIHETWILFSLVPLAGATVFYALELNVYPEKAAMSILLSTIIALFYIPFIYTVFFL
ncbi:MAG: AEC family transporter [Alphaproteobacteria bacterium]